MDSWTYVPWIIAAVFAVLAAYERGRAHAFTRDMLPIINRFADLYAKLSKEGEDA